MSLNTVSADTPVVATCFIDKLSAMFAKNNVPNPTAWEGCLPGMARQLTDDPHRQRFIVNSFWRHELGVAGVKQGVNTSDARYSIVDAKTDEDTLVRLYEQNVLPWIIKLNLPATNQS